MSGILWSLLFLVIVVAGLRIFAPMRLVRLVIGLVRRWGRLTASTVDVNGMIWPYLKGGPVNGEVVVMVHGFGGDKDNWPLYARHFTKRYRVIAPDLPGFGETVRNPDLDYGMQAQAARLRDFLHALDIDKFHLTGNSMGGFIAIYYALDYPQDLQSLTLFDNAGVQSKNKSELEIAIGQKKNLLVAKNLEEFEKILAFITYKPIPSPKFMRLAMMEIQRRNYEFLDKVFWDLAEEATNHTVTDRLSEIPVPTLVIWGRHDRVLDVSCTEAMAASIPDNKIVIFEDVGHIPMVEKPQDSARHQLALLAAN